MKDPIVVPGHRIRIYWGATFCRTDDERRTLHFEYHWPIFFPRRRAVRALARHLEASS